MAARTPSWHMGASGKCMGVVKPPRGQRPTNSIRKPRTPHAWRFFAQAGVQNGPDYLNQLLQTMHDKSAEVYGRRFGFDLLAALKP